MSARLELRALTGVRGVAAWMVVLYHIRLSIAGLPHDVVAVLGKGYLAVDFFFLLSGFVIWMTWGDRLREGGWSARASFLQKRIARIWPLHAVVLAGGAALALLLAATGRRNETMFPSDEFTANLLLVQNWGVADRLAWNVPSWSISTELLAYLTFPLLVFAIDLRRLSSASLVVLIGVTLFALSTLYTARGVTQLGEFIPQLGAFRCLAQFACGAMVAALWTRWRTQPVLPIVVATTAALSLLAALGAGAVVETLGVPALFAALLLVLALTAGVRGNPFEGRVVHYLGEISYATYLGHFLLWFAFKLAFVDDPHAVPPALIALYLAMVLGSSIALYHWVERPAQRWVNGLRRSHVVIPAKAGTNSG